MPRLNNGLIFATFSQSINQVSPQQGNTFLQEKNEMKLLKFLRRFVPRLDEFQDWTRLGEV